MRKLVILFSSCATILMATLGIGAANAAASDVLTVGSVGGTNVAVNDVLTAGLAAGTNATFQSGFLNITCSASSLSSSVTSNPASPGTATESGQSVAFGSGSPTTCTSNLGVATMSVSAPGSLSVSSSLMVDWSGLKIHVTVTFGGVTISCWYQTGGAQTGTASNTDNSISFNKITLSLQAGSNLNCSATINLTSKYAPRVDTTQGNQKVFGN